MTSIQEQRSTTGRRAEDLVAQELAAAGFTVVNLNDLVGNCPFADLLARKGPTRLLVQVKGTETDEGKFGTPPRRVRALEAISTELGCEAIYAFVHLTVANPTIRYAAAAQVAVLADEEEEAYWGILRYHVVIDQFDVTVDQISSLWEMEDTSPATADQEDE
jgi:hypothetical protein